MGAFKKYMCLCRATTTNYLAPAQVLNMAGATGEYQQVGRSEPAENAPPSSLPNAKGQRSQAQEEGGAAHVFGIKHPPPFPAWGDTGVAWSWRAKRQSQLATTPPTPGRRGRGHSAYSA
eukprot:CAMPEP_0182573324 /NCGR_PEP_ID=MMETSP1324-20130603/19468_1 /TAXON_ID=236786 /ORGANISM="Florenciella sp., Strain RCC1587" /LENGTH=118 /DNA_ID=CAMNT_0024788411 /DNA_START=677 /DNA_END=1031 /DNA_ORIENTATION=+